MNCCGECIAVTPLSPISRMKKIVIDKSFLDGAPAIQVRELVEHYEVLVIESLFYELMTTEDDRRKKAFTKLPQEARTFTLVPNVGTLLRYEIKERQPCGNLDNCCIEGNHQFHEGLRDGSYVPGGQVLEDLKEWEVHVESATQRFLNW